MNFKDLNLGKKLGFGFGALILITMLSQLLIIFYISNIEDKSEILAHEYIAEVKIANALERATHQTMYNVLGYALSYKDSYYTTAQQHISKVKDQVDKADQLANDATSLVKLQESINEIDEKVLAYNRLMGETKTMVDNIFKTRDQLDAAAARYMDNCRQYLESQNRQMENEIRAGASAAQLTERLQKIMLINDIIDSGNETRVSNFKAQSINDTQMLQQAIGNFDRIDGLIQQLRDITRRSEDIQQLNGIESSATAYKTAMTNMSEIFTRSEELAQNRIDAGFAVFDNSKIISDAGIQGTIDTADNTIALINRSNASIWIGGIIVLGLGILLAVSITKLITVPIAKGVEFARKIAKGDLTAEIDVDQKDEVGQLAAALREMIEKLRGIVTSIIEGSNNIASASIEMSSNSQQVSQGATEQASSTEEVSSSMEEMTSNIQQNTDNAQQTEKIANKAANDIMEGSKNVNKTVDSMKTIADRITIISDIAFQTNILALNAAVEAARAGEHGKGFAVVAAEVRKLAERSQKAAAEIDDLSKSSVAIAEHSGSLLQQIVPDIQNTSKLVQEISAASIEQNSGVDQINNAIQQLNQVTQQNAAASEEMATSSEELSSQAEQLREIIQFFNTNESSRLNSKIQNKPKPQPKTNKHTNYNNDNYQSSINTNKSTPAFDNDSPDKGIRLDLGKSDSMDDDYENF